jgi:hypothetical protein
MLSKVFTAVALVALGVMVEASPAPTPLTDIEALTGRATPLAQLITKCEVANTVALTFDDGPEEYIYVCIPITFSSETTDLRVNCEQNISRQLIAADAKGTFFWNGNNCEPWLYLSAIVHFESNGFH